MKIIVTGGTGFLGGWVVSEFLDIGYDVISIRNKDVQAKYRDDLVISYSAS